MSILRNSEYRLDSDGVWAAGRGKRFGYSDGLESEEYLEQVFRSASDLSSTSVEPEGWIKDWASEYHLSRTRSQLLRPFGFDRKARALEVGCGCGAITRFLGETLFIANVQDAGESIHQQEIHATESEVLRTLFGANQGDAHFAELVALIGSTTWRTDWDESSTVT